MRVALTHLPQQFSANVSLAQTDDIADVAAPVCLNHSQRLSDCDKLEISELAAPRFKG